jgi:hypothetical protein
VTLGPPGDPAENAMLGTVTPFPPDAPAAFVIPVRADAQQAIERAGGSAQLIVELVPIDRAKLLAKPLDVRLIAGFR